MWARKMNGGPGTDRARRAEQFPHLGNYTLTPAYYTKTIQMHYNATVDALNKNLRAEK